MNAKHLWRIPVVLALLVMLFCVPALVLTNGALMSELLALTPYTQPWEVPLRVTVVLALCWVWLWTEGTAFQIALALLLWFCIGWALCLVLRPRRAKTSRP